MTAHEPDWAEMARAMVLAAESLQRLPVEGGRVTLAPAFRDKLCTAIRDVAEMLDVLAIEMERAE